MRYIKSFVILVLLLLMTSCYDYSDEGKHWTESWIATMNIDGSEVNYLFKGDMTPFYVKDLSDTTNEKILLDYSEYIVSMNTDGSKQETVLSEVGNIVEVSRDKTKILLEYNQDIYIANVDGTGLRNITNTPNLSERNAAISADNNKVVFVRNESIIDNYYVISLNLYDLNIDISTKLFQEERNSYFIYEKIYVLQDYVYFYRTYYDEEENEGLFRIDLNNNENIKVYDNYVNSNIVSDYTDVFYFANLSTQSVIEIDLQTFIIQGYIGESKVIGNPIDLIISPHNEYLCISNSQKNDFMYDISTDEYYYNPRSIRDASFNSEATHIVCVVERFFPQDF